MIHSWISYYCQYYQFILCYLSEEGAVIPLSLVILPSMLLQNFFIKMRLSYHVAGFGQNCLGLLIRYRLLQQARRLMKHVEFTIADLKAFSVIDRGKENITSSLTAQAYMCRHAPEMWLSKHKDTLQYCALTRIWELESNLSNYSVHVPKLSPYTKGDLEGLCYHRTRKFSQ